MKRVTFRFTLTTAFLGVLFTAVSTLAFVSFHFSRKNAEALSNQILDQTTERIRLHTQSLLDTALEQSTTLTKLLETGFLRQPAAQRETIMAEDFRYLGGYFYNAMSVHDSLAYISLALPDTGEYIFVERREENLKIREYRLVDGIGIQIFDYDNFSSDRTPINTPEYNGYDPRARPFYQTAIAAGEMTWTNAYVFIGTDDASSTPGITLTTPVFSPESNELIAVTTTDFELQGLCDFLAQAQVGTSGFAFIMETQMDGTQRIIAHPDCGLLIETASAEDGSITRNLIPADQIQDDIIVSLINSISSDRLIAQRPDTIEFSVGSDIYWGRLFQLQDGQNPAWTIGLVLPRSDVMSEVENNNRINLILGSISVIIAAILVALVSKSIASPLQSLASATEDIGKFELQPKKWKRSIIVEIDRLTEAVEEAKLSLRSFQKYVPADLVRDLMRRGVEAKLGGRTATLTIYFSDIADFTSIAEQMPPTELVDHIGHYLGEMSNQVIKNKGTVDKYIGDAIMAFWGAPEDNPEHCIKACQTALTNQAILDQLREQWQQSQLPAFHDRIGIHTGEVIVGNIGSPQRMDYTILGDNVNLAQRLENLNKYYNTHILISQTTFNEVRDKVITRHLDFIAVKGRRDAIHIYELIGLKENVSSEQAKLADLYSDALCDYHQRRWEIALTKFKHYLELCPNDKPAQILIERCQQCQDHPPDADWTGIYRADMKF